MTFTFNELVRDLRPAAVEVAVTPNPCDFSLTAFDVPDAVASEPRTTKPHEEQEETMQRAARSELVEHRGCALLGAVQSVRAARVDVSPIQPWRQKTILKS